MHDATMKLRLLAVMALLAVLPFAGHTGEDATIKIHLEPSSDESVQGGYSPLIFNDKGEATLEFATATGKLLFKIDGKKVKVDKNCDGKFTDADGPALGRGEEVTIPIKVHGKDVKYVIAVTVHKYGCYTQGMTCLKGKYKDKVVFVNDWNMNGKFDDKSIDMISVGNQIKYAPITQIYNLDGQIKKLKFDTDTATLEFSPYTGDVGMVKLNCGNANWCGVVALSKIDGSFFVTADSSKTTQLVPGTYVIRYARYLNGSVDCNKSKGYVMGRSNMQIEIKKGDNQLKMGAPFTLDFAVNKSGEDLKLFEIKEINLIGAGGIKYQASTNGSKSKSTLHSFVQAGDKKKKLSKMEYG